jgi:hypothetical protein
LSRTRTATSSTSSGASKTPLILNVFSNGGSSSDDDSGRDLKSPPENNYAEMHASTSRTTQGEEELVPGEINTKHGSINVSPEGHTQGTGASHRSDPRSNYFPSVVSATPEVLPDYYSTSTQNLKSSQETIASWTSNRTTKGRSKHRLDL